MMRPVLNGRGGTLPVRGRGGQVRSKLVLARGQGWHTTVTPVVSTLQFPKPISLQTHIDHQIQCAIQCSNEVNGIGFRNN